MPILYQTLCSVVALRCDSALASDPEGSQTRLKDSTDEEPDLTQEGSTEMQRRGLVG